MTKKRFTEIVKIAQNWANVATKMASKMPTNEEAQSLAVCARIHARGTAIIADPTRDCHSHHPDNVVQTMKCALNSAKRARASARAVEEIQCAVARSTQP